MEPTMATKHNRSTLVLPLFAALLLIASLVGCGREAAEEHAEEPGRGPHGGKLLTEDDFALEVQIAEQGIPPEYRLYG